MTSSILSQNPGKNRTWQFREYTDEEILAAATAVSFDDIGQPCLFKIRDVRREILKNIEKKRGYEISDQRHSTLTGEKVSKVLRSYPERFLTVSDVKGRVKAFRRAGCDHEENSCLRNPGRDDGRAYPYGHRLSAGKHIDNRANTETKTDPIPIPRVPEIRKMNPKNTHELYVGLSMDRKTECVTGDGCMTEKIIKPEDFQAFTFENGQKLRVIVENGEPLFLAGDICKALGYGNPHRAMTTHCKENGIRKLNTLTNGGNQTLFYIDEANVRRLIMRSKMPKAEEFQDWMCEVVLPSIRKTGKYERGIAGGPVPEKVYRMDDLRRWLYHHGFYNTRAKENDVFVPPRILLKSMKVLGFLYKDVKNRNWVATHHAIENSFCINIPVNRVITFNRAGGIKKINTRYAFAVTEAGANEYAQELRRLAKKYKIQTTTQAKHSREPGKMIFDNDPDHPKSLRFCEGFDGEPRDFRKATSCTAETGTTPDTLAAKHRKASGREERKKDSYFNYCINYKPVSKTVFSDMKKRRESRWHQSAI